MTMMSKLQNEVNSTVESFSKYISGISYKLDITLSFPLLLKSDKKNINKKVIGPKTSLKKHVVLFLFFYSLKIF